MQTNSNQVVDVRKRLGITQKCLAEMLGITSNYVYLMESGKKPITELIRLKLDKLAGVKFYRREESGLADGKGNATGPKTVEEHGDAEVSMFKGEHRTIEARLDAIEAALGRVLALLEKK